MKNRASNTYKIADGQFTMVDDKGEETFENFSSAPWRSLGNGKMLPGDSRRGRLGFLVPKRHKPAELRWEPFSGSEAVYRWDLSGS